MRLPVLTSYLWSGCFRPHQSLLLLRGVEQEVGSILSSAESRSPPVHSPVTVTLPPGGSQPIRLTLQRRWSP